METFVWDHNFITGVEDVDAQHRVLVDLFNELSATFSSADGNRDAVLTETFARLLAYTEYHFRDEEALMRGVGVDARHIELHTAQHAQFVAQITATWAARQTLPNAAESIVGFLVSWLGLHILGTDQALARQIVAMAAGASAAEAWEREVAVGSTSNSQQALLKVIGRLYHVLAGQNADLMAANRHLEERVAERTEALERTNDDLRRANLQLEAFSRTDSLLGIANRAYFQERLDLACAAAFRREQPMALLMIDVDHFKEYNDWYGHPAGDACLQAVAQAVQQAMVRSTDMVARYGGEELVAVLPDTDVAGATTVAARVVEHVAALGLAHAASPVAPQVTVSVGVAAQVPPGQRDSASLVQEADAALYEAKAAGRNRWVLAL